MKQTTKSSSVSRPSGMPALTLLIITDRPSTWEHIFLRGSPPVQTTQCFPGTSPQPGCAGWSAFPGSHLRTFVPAIPDHHSMAHLTPPHRACLDSPGPLPRSCQPSGMNRNRAVCIVRLQGPFLRVRLEFQLYPQLWGGVRQTHGAQYSHGSGSASPTSTSQPTLGGKYLF